MKYLFSYLKKYRVESILAPLFKMLEAFFDLRVPLIVANIINTGINGVFADEAARLPYILGQCGLLVIMALIGLACSFTAQYFAARAAIGTSTQLRHHLMPERRNANCSHLNGSMLELFDQALELYPAMVAQVAAYLQNQKPFGKEFDPDFG